jgi:hypothetical protein
MRGLLRSVAGLAPWALLLGFWLEAAEIQVFKKYNTPTAIVNYAITSTRLSQAHEYLEVNGTATLLFSDWGARALYKEKTIRKTQGAIKKSESVRTLVVEDREIVYQVDFDVQRIIKRIDPIRRSQIERNDNLYQDKMQNLSQHGKKIGDSVIMGLPCEEWQLNARTVCLYEGIPLLEKKTISQTTSIIKRAVLVKLKAPQIPDDVYALPDMKLLEEKGFLLKEYDAALFADTSETFKEKLAKTSKSPAAKRADKERFRQQKALMITLLDALRESRICLINAETRTEANVCLGPVVEIEEQLSGHRSEKWTVSTWTNVAQEHMIDSLDQKIVSLQQKMPCIRRSRNTENLAECIDEQDAER